MHKYLYICSFFFLGYTNSILANFSGMAEYGRVTSREVFYNENSERVTRVCFSLETDYHQLIGLDFSDVLDEYQGVLGNEYVSDFVNLSESEGYGFIYNLDNLNVKVLFNVENTSLQGNSVEYTSSVFERDFNTDRDNGQVRYLVEEKGNNSNLFTIETCEVYFFNSLATPEEFVEFLLTMPVVGFYRFQLTVHLAIEISYRNTGAVVAKLSMPLDLDYRVPIVGMGDIVTDNSIAEIQAESRKLLSDNFNQKISGISSLHLDKAKEKVKRWYESSRSGSTVRVHSVSEITECTAAEVSAQYVGTSTGTFNPINKYNALYSSNGCLTQRTAVLSTEVECIPWMAGDACEVATAGGTYYIFQDFRGRSSVIYLTDTDEKIVVPEAHEEFNQESLFIPNPEHCISGLANQGSLGTSSTDTSNFDDDLDGRFIVEDVLDEIVQRYSRDDNFPLCKRELVQHDAEIFSCSQFKSGNLLCSAFYGGVLHGLLTHQGLGVINYTIDEDYTLDTDSDSQNDYLDLDDDNDGLPDIWEMRYGLNTKDHADAHEDSDGDGLSNIEEYQYDLHPLESDTDGDGVDDGREIELGEDPKLNKAVLVVIINHILL